MPVTQNGFDAGVPDIRVADSGCRIAQHDLAQALRRIDRQPLTDQAAHGQTTEKSRVYVQRIQQRQHVATILLDAVTALADQRFAMPARVVAQHLKMTNERRNLVVPHMQISAQRVGQYQHRRTGRAFEQVVQFTIGELHGRHSRLRRRTNLHTNECRSSIQSADRISVRLSNSLPLDASLKENSVNKTRHKEDIARFCLDLPGAREDYKWGGVRVFSVAEKKMFAVMDLVGQDLSFKVHPELFLGYVDRPGIRPAPYLARAHWISVADLHTLSDYEVRDLLTRSHQLVVGRLPKRQQIGLKL
ncbi:hypothetical protein ALQ45_04862 [Pseudomonas amygdali pv. morsprunorum]|nr:hypothetical protein ALQ45_04862 [Pseudomonas amygdali pv. morsprunorum]RMU33665.1 hypothetical protein ALP31_05414 [Pseudomonas amygdali pv. morsprunorum]